MDQSRTNLAPEMNREHPQNEAKLLQKQENSGEKIDVDNSQILETVSLDEAGAEINGEVSEKGAAGKEMKAGSMTGGVRGAYDPAQIRENLLNNLPSEAVMRKQIEREIQKEINYLHKKAVKMLRSPKEMDYFEMSNLVKKIRELKSILYSMVKISVDGLKTLWLRFVHGIM